MQSTTNLPDSHLDIVQESKTLGGQDKNSILDKINSQIDGLFTAITKLIQDSQNQLNEETQEKIAKISILLPKIKKICGSGNFQKNTQKQAEIESLLMNLGLAIQAMQNQENITLIKRLRRNVECSVRRLENFGLGFLVNSYKKFLYQSTIPIKLLLGLILAIPLYVGIPSSLYLLGSNHIEDILIQKEVISESEEARKNETPDLYKKDYEQSSACM